jgi:hypothetical protein
MIAALTTPLALGMTAAVWAAAPTAMPLPESPHYVLPPNAVPPVKLPCERACMEDLAERFVTALATHDPQSLPLAGTVRYTESGQEMALGDGLWGTTSDVGSYRHVFADPATGEIALFATMKENGRPFIMGARLKVEIGRITEIEVVLYRTGSGPAWNDAGALALEKMGKPRDLWNTAPAAGERRSRQELVAVANSYFDSLQRNDGKGDYPFTPDCDRLENGTYTTNNPGLVRMGDIDIGGMGCTEQFKTGLYGVVTRIHHRRFLIVDEARSAVVAIGVFDHAGTIKELTTPTGQKVSTGMFSRPSSILIFEAFKIKGDRIQQVEAVGASVPYHMHPGWGER